MEFSIDLSRPVLTRNTKRIDDTQAVAERHAVLHVLRLNVSQPA
jgi:hypothetical protein